MVINKFLHMLPWAQQKAIAMKNSSNFGWLFELVELAESTHTRDAEKRIPTFPNKTMSERRQPEHTFPLEHPIVVGIHTDAKLLNSPNTHAWIAIVHPIKCSHGENHLN